MRNILSTLVLVFITSHLTAQEMNINFIASGDTDRIENIIVYNLSNNESVTLAGDDTLFLKTTSQQTIALNANKENMFVYPNPFDLSATLNININKPQHVRISAMNYLSATVAKCEADLDSGSHLFELKINKRGIFLINISTPEGSGSIKVICKSDRKAVPAISYIGQIFDNSVLTESSSSGKISGTITSKRKSGCYKKEIHYKSGDVLLYECKSGNFQTVVTDTPGISKKQEVKFTTCRDFDGNHYKVVTIGNQLWMAENLRTVHYANGDTIFQITNDSIWVTLTRGASIVYLYDSVNLEMFGLQYNWYAAADKRNVCPTGWRLPSDADWDALQDYLGGQSVAGGKLKEIRPSIWSVPNSGANNSSGFSALPGGGHNNDGVWYNYGNDTYFWSSTDKDSTIAYNRLLHFKSSIFYRNFHVKKDGFSVRCIKD
jgi:uncharacterized protein (TIGR02145 family)